MFPSTIFTIRPSTSSWTVAFIDLSSMVCIIPYPDSSGCTIDVWALHAAGGMQRRTPNPGMVANTRTGKLVYPLRGLFGDQVGTPGRSVPDYPAVRTGRSGRDHAPGIV